MEGARELNEEEAQLYNQSFLEDPSILEKHRAAAEISNSK